MTMMIMLHIGIALTSLIISVVGVFVPSRRLMQISYGFIAATLATGVGLLAIEPLHMAQVCVSGLTYVAVATTLTLVTRFRMKRTVAKI